MYIYSIKTYELAASFLILLYFYEIILWWIKTSDIICVPTVKDASLKFLQVELVIDITIDNATDISDNTSDEYADVFQKMKTAVSIIPYFTRFSIKLLEQGYGKERLKSSLEKCSGWYGDLIKQYEVPLSRMLNDLL